MLIETMEQALTSLAALCHRLERPVERISNGKTIAGCATQCPISCCASEEIRAPGLKQAVCSPAQLADVNRPADLSQIVLVRRRFCEVANTPDDALEINSLAWRMALPRGIEPLFSP